MKILLISGIFPPDIGGPATYVSRFAQDLFQHGHQVEVLTLGEDAQPCPFPVRRVSRRYPLPFRLAYLFLILLRDGRRSAVWYINGLELPAMLAGKLLKKRLVLKVVSDYAWERAGNQGLTTDTVQDFQTKRQHWKVELHKTLRAWVARHVKVVITPSRHVQRLVCGWGVPEERVQVIHNAVEEVADHALTTKLAERQSLHLPEAAFLIITIGRLIALKGIDQLIRVIAVLRQTGDFQEDYHLVVVGDGPEKNNLTELARTLNLTEYIHFIGQIERQLAMRYLRAADIFTLNSSTEGLSHVILEAMLVGTPVIATDVGGNPELITHQENGLLIPHGQFDVLINHIRLLIHDQTLQQQYSEAGRRTVQQFAWEHLRQQTLKVLQAE